MSFRGLVDTQLRSAFKTAKDLALDAVFVKKVVTGFNFGTGDAVASSDGNVSAKVIVTETKKKNNVTTKTLMVQSSEVGALNDYTKVILDDGTYNFGNPIKNTGFILLVSVTKEG